MPRRRNLSSRPSVVAHATAAVVEAVEARRLLSVSITALDNAAAEPSDTGEFVVTRTDPPNAALVVTIAVSGIASRGIDYTLNYPSADPAVDPPLIAGNTVTIPAGLTTVDVLVTPINDRVYEKTEGVTVSLVGNVRYSLGTPSRASVTIRDDDPKPPTINPSTPLGLNSSGNSTGDFGTSGASISADGKYAVYLSRATDEVTAPLTTFLQVYRRDLVNGTTTLVSRSADGTKEGDADAVAASISGDGRYVAFETTASNIMKSGTDGNGVSDVYIRDMQTGTVSLVTKSGSKAVGGSLVDLSDDGRQVLFETSTNANKFVTGITDTNAGDDLFVWTRESGKYKAVTVSSSDDHTGDRSTTADLPFVGYASDSNGTVSTTTTGDVTVQSAINGINIAGNDGTGKAMFSADGRFVLFPSRASNLVAGVTDGNTFQYDLFVRDLVHNSTRYVSMSATTANTSGDDDSGDGEITADGRYVVYRSNARDLVANDRNDASDIFLRDMTNGTTTLVSKRVRPADETSAKAAAKLGDSAQGYSFTPDITSDGHYIAFASNADDVTQDGLDTNGATDVFRYEVATGKVRLVSVSIDGHSAFGASFDPSISENGQSVLFSSNADNLPSDVAKLTTDFSAVYVRNVDTRVSRAVSLNSGDKFSTTGSATDAVFSADGTKILYTSFADDFGTGTDGNGEGDVFVLDTPGGEAVRLVQDPSVFTDTDINNDDDGVLVITGSPLADQISVQKTGASKLVVRRDGVESTFRVSNITAISITGGAGNDRISIATSVRGTRVNGDDGNDTITGGSAADTFYGGAGNDLLVGNAGNDELHGGSGRDTLQGGADNDSLFGDAGIDVIDGGAGTDTAVGSDAGDILTSTEA